MKVSNIVAGAIVGVALAAGAANANTVVFYSYGQGSPTETLITNFTGPGYTLGDAPTAAGWSLANPTGSVQVLDTTDGDGADPAVLTNPANPNSAAQGTAPYLSVLGVNPQQIQITYTLPTSAYTTLGLYIGSLDSYNTLLFTLKDGTQVQYTGAQLGAVSGADNGGQTEANTNGEFVFGFGQAVTSIGFSSTSNSFEIASIAGEVPEPATWAMMILGVGLVGVGARRRRGAVALAA